jgi:GMP synthase-like glutamine amidotransferase
MAHSGPVAARPAQASIRVHWFQHVPFEGLGAIGPWLTARGARITATKCHAGESLPALADLDWLIVMGGPMSVHDRDRYQWLADEQRLIADAIAAGKTVLGVCLGAQLIAHSLGARVYRAPEREIGWFPIAPVTPSTGPFANLLAEPQSVFHWHGETFELPPGTVLLARSAACEHQAFALGPRVLALQFHLEMTPDGARTLIEHCPADLAPGRWVQSAAALCGPAAPFGRANALMHRMLDALDRAPAPTPADARP